MSRDSSVYLDDILGPIGRIDRYTNGLSRHAFVADEKTVDAVVRNIPIHEYFGIDVDIVWEIVATKLPHLERTVAAMSTR